MVPVASRENAFVCRGRQKYCGQRKPRASWKKAGRTARLTFHKDVFPKINGNVAFVCLGRSL